MGFPGPRFPTMCMPKAVLTVLLEHFTCPYQQSLLSFRMKSRPSMLSRASSSVDLMLAVSYGLTLQICLIIALSFRCRCWRLGFDYGQVSLAWSFALRTHKLYIRPTVWKERWCEERTGISSLNELLPGRFHVLWSKVKYLRISLTYLSCNHIGKRICLT